MLILTPTAPNLEDHLSALWVLLARLPHSKKEKVPWIGQGLYKTSDLAVGTVDFHCYKRITVLSSRNVTN